MASALQGTGSRHPIWVRQSRILIPEHSLIISQALVSKHGVCTVPIDPSAQSTPCVHCSHNCDKVHLKVCAASDCTRAGSPNKFATPGTNRGLY